MTVLLYIQILTAVSVVCFCLWGIWKTYPRTAKSNPVDDDLDRLYRVNGVLEKLNAEYATLKSQYDTLLLSRDEMVNSLSAARMANRELRQGWDLTCRELREALKDKAGLQQQIESLTMTLERSDQVKTISEARIRELESMLSAEVLKFLEEKRQHAATVDLMNDRGNRISELENALQAIRDCIDDQMTENFVTPRGSEAFGG